MLAEGDLYATLISSRRFPTRFPMSFARMLRLRSPAMSRSSNPTHSTVIAADRVKSDQRIAQNLVELARISRDDRVLVAGSLRAAVIVELHRNACACAAVTAFHGSLRGLYDAALVPWHRNSIESLDVTLGWLVQFIRNQGIVAVWIGRDEDAARKLRLMLKRLGFRIEAGTTFENGLAVVARRRESNSFAIAA